MARVKILIKDSDQNFRKFKKQLRDGPDQINVGIFGKQGSDLVIYATQNEFGTSRIPERSFLRSAISENSVNIINFIGREAHRIISGKQSKLIALKRIGLFVEAKVVEKIIKGPFKPNAPFTIAQKGSSRPLIDTGRMRQSIISEVVKKVVK